MMMKRFLRLMKHPITEVKKIAPFTTIFLNNTKRNTSEFFGNGKYSIVYEGHNDLLKYLNFKKHGFFIECGSNNGQRSDPTYFLEKILRWNGILIEPLPDAHRVCAQKRKRSQVYNYALVSDDYMEPTIKLIDCKLMTIVKGIDGYENWVKDGENVQKYKSKEIIVPATTLNRILDEYYEKYTRNIIDLLVIDTEGYEMNILKGINLNKYKPQNLLIEIQTENRKNDIDNYLKNKYVLISKIGYADYFYKRI